jgi:amino acid transporter
VAYKISIREPANTLHRTLSLPWLVFYGVGITVGAGIFALIGDIVALAGDHAPLAFLVAGIVAAFTGFSYAALASAYPRAAGEAIFVKVGFGAAAGKIVGLGIVTVAITSSAVISLAFAGYLGTLVAIPRSLSVMGILALLALIAWQGVRESVAFAAFITVLEVGTLLLVIAGGLSSFGDQAAVERVFSFPPSGAAWLSVMGGAFVAFFAFIGFEDIENLAEETLEASRTIPLAIILTLVISVAIYGLVAVVAVAYPGRAALTGSDAPLAVLFEGTTGLPAAPVAAMASIAMVNGILVQIVMASRVLYGMAQEGMIPMGFGMLDPARRTPARAIFLVAAISCLFALLVPILKLAELTSFVMLLIFTLVNASLFLIGRRDGAPDKLRRWRWWGAFGAVISSGLAVAEVLG